VFVLRYSLVGWRDTALFVVKLGFYCICSIPCAVSCALCFLRCFPDAIEDCLPVVWFLPCLFCLEPWVLLFVIALFATIMFPVLDFPAFHSYRAILLCLGPVGINMMSIPTAILLGFLAIHFYNQFLRSGKKVDEFMRDWAVDWILAVLNIGSSWHAFANCFQERTGTYYLSWQLSSCAVGTFAFGACFIYEKLGVTPFRFLKDIKSASSFWASAVVVSAMVYANLVHIFIAVFALLEEALHSRLDHLLGPLLALRTVQTNQIDVQEEI